MTEPVQLLFDQTGHLQLMRCIVHMVLVMGTNQSYLWPVSFAIPYKLQPLISHQGWHVLLVMNMLFAISHMCSVDRKRRTRLPKIVVGKQGTSQRIQSFFSLGDKNGRTENQKSHYGIQHLSSLFTHLNTSASTWMHTCKTADKGEAYNKELYCK